MGSGKTSVGRVLAKRLGYSFVDTDAFIEDRTGRPIPEIFKSDGEAAFRRIESAALKEVLAGKGKVVSCGGGVVLREENRSELKQRAIVVYLKAGSRELFARVGATGEDRPLLKADNPEAEIQRLLKEREPLYESIADITIDTSGKTILSVVDTIAEELKTKGQRTGEI
jgi:shikimate kinase